MEQQSLGVEIVISSTSSGSPFLSTPARTLAEVCRGLGRDLGGRACPQCAVRDFCKRTDTSGERGEDLVKPGEIVPPAKRQSDFQREVMMAA